MAHIDDWAKSAYYNTEDTIAPWDELPESSRVLWRDFVLETFIGRVRNGND